VLGESNTSATKNTAGPETDLTLGRMAAKNVPPQKPTLWAQYP